MSTFEKEMAKIGAKRNVAEIVVQTLGSFKVWNQEELMDPKAWGRDSSNQLFQFFITARHRHGLHKEQIIDRIWPEMDMKSGAQNFKVALHGLNKALEPNRQSRATPRYILRQGLSYQLNLQYFWVDVDALEAYIALGNQYLQRDPGQAERAYAKAFELYEGIYLPNRLYEDWSSDERERVQVLSLGALITKAELLLAKAPQETIRLAQRALLIDPSWEEAYRLQMQAYLQKGNRPMAIKTFQQCEKVLDEEFGIDPLPATRKVYEQVLSL
ncbi:MAG TPA: bacterial transcriptional activator domain-containing protein [Saprospiraceae bacterium]|nr:bacterial transcriptional activator domain-containing protein [Saprospiraceae bacterium]